MTITTLLPFKLVLVPLLIWLISYAGRRWGPVVAGSLSAFPVVAGPALLFVAIEQGTSFAANAAIGSISAVFALVTFSLAYVWGATRFTWVWSLVVALVSYLVAIMGIHVADLSLSVSAVMVTLLLIFVQRFFPKWRQVPSSGRPVMLFDVPLRMLFGGCLVYGLTVVAAEIGPNWSGIFAMFPVTGSVLLVFSHIFQGRDFAINLVYGMFLGWCSITIFCFTLGALLPSFGLASTFILALILAIAAQGAGYAFRRWGGAFAVILPERSGGQK